MGMTPGQRLGVYRVIREGHVETLKSKFLAEGKVLARLRNPNLVHVFDLNFDEKAGTLYFVMDLVLAEDGNPHTLSDVKTAELDEDRILQWFTELAAAVDYIHEQGVVHRDIKLGNVLLSANDHVVLSDFGVSHLFSDRLRTDVNAVKTMVSEACTCNRLVMGTQGYIAPEIVHGEEATSAADSYSLGVMFVYLLTGIWYEPGSKVFKLLETLEYRWIDVLPRLLAENPAERPTNLKELAGLLTHKTGETPSSSGAGETPPPLKDASSRGGAVSAPLKAQECRDSIKSILNGMIKIPGRDCWLSSTELTQGQWEAVMGYNLSQHKGVNLSVENVSRDDCDVFLEKLNQTKEAQTARFEFCLPKLVDWTYAARAGADGTNCWISPGVVGNVLDMAWVKENSANETHPVGTKSPNAFGFYDMLGNVWEWMDCEDATIGCRHGCSFYDSVGDCTVKKGFHTKRSGRYECCGLRLAARVRPAAAEHADSGKSIEKAKENVI